MVKFLMLLIISFLLQNLAQGQIKDLPINHFDKDGKKHGYWKTYIDSNINVVKDTSKATWFYYSLYFHGKTFIGYKNNFVDKKALNVVNFLDRPKFRKIKKSIPSIDGKVRAINSLDSTEAILLFKDGYFLKKTLIYGNSRKNWEVIDYTNKYKNNPFSFFYKSPTIWNNGKLKEGYYYYEEGKSKLRKAFEKVKVESTKYEDNL